MVMLANAKYEHFAQLVAKGETPPKAYVAVGYSDKGAAQSANRLLRVAEVCARVAEIRAAVNERMIEKTAYDLGAAMIEAEEARALAVEVRNPAAAVAAVGLKAKLNGLLIDRKEVRTGTLDDKSDAELDAIIQRAAAEIQTGLGDAGKGSETKH